MKIHLHIERVVLDGVAVDQPFMRKALGVGTHASVNRTWVISRAAERRGGVAPQTRENEYSVNGSAWRCGTRHSTRGSRCPCSGKHCDTSHDSRAGKQVEARASLRGGVGR